MWPRTSPVLQICGSSPICTSSQLTWMSQPVFWSELKPLYLCCSHCFFASYLIRIPDLQRNAELSKQVSTGRSHRTAPGEFPKNFVDSKASPNIREKTSLAFPREAGPRVTIVSSCISSARTGAQKGGNAVCTSAHDRCGHTHTPLSVCVLASKESPHP